MTSRLLDHSGRPDDQHVVQPLVAGSRDDAEPDLACSRVLHGVNAAEAVVLRRKLRRKEMVSFFEKLAPTVIAIEACGAARQSG